MSRYTGPKHKLVRKLGNLPGLTTKMAKTQKFKKSNLSEYGIRLQEKQKLKFNYGISEKQLFNYIKEARRIKGATGSNLIQLLEMRFDNIIYRLGFAPTIPAARQLITHGHVLLNGKSLSFPSFQCSPNDVITFKEKSISQKLLKLNLERNTSSSNPRHLSLQNKEGSSVGTILGIVNPRDIELKIKELLIVEFYSRK